MRDVCTGRPCTILFSVAFDDSTILEEADKECDEQL